MASLISRTRWGGVTDDLSPSGTGFFRVGRIAGAWWLLDPDGGRFLSKGITTVRFDQDQIQNTDRIPYAEACQRKYGSRNAWRAAAARRLSSWGFNSLGAWSDEAVAKAGPSLLSLAANLDLGASFAWRKRSGYRAGVDDVFPDVFDPDFGLHVHRRASELCQSWRDDPAIIGWFTDNELRWDPDWRGTDELLTIFLNLSPPSPGRHAAVELLRQRYHGIFERCNDVWCTPSRSWDELATLTLIEAPYEREPFYERNESIERERNADQPKRGSFVGDCEAFAARLADRYFATMVAAVKAIDPNHLVLGCRFAFPPQPAIIEAAARHLDVISLNCYGLDPGPAIDAFAEAQKPCLIGEFSFRAEDSGLPNTRGAGPVVSNQTERARCFQRYVVAALQRPSVVGYHWFEHADQPAEGRFDGENSNYGTVTIRDDVYEELTQAMRQLNDQAEDIHTGGARASA